MKISTLPTSRELFESVGLYVPFEITSAETKAVIELLYLGSSYDAYCVECQRDATFKVSAGTNPVGSEQLLTQLAYITSGTSVKPSIFNSGVYVLKGECTRVAGHLQAHILFIGKRTLKTDGNAPVEGHFLQKIGQYPSSADLSSARIKKYATVLNKDQMHEFSKSIGLASHGVGVGSFVYLRRIFESLVEQAHQEALTDKRWNEAKYNKSRVGEKIKLLKHHLPEFLVENHQVYALMSKGIHELSEKECIEHFQTVRVCIELILDEKVAKNEQKKKIESARSDLTKSINAITGRRA